MIIIRLIVIAALTVGGYFLGNRFFEGILITIPGTDLKVLASGLLAIIGFVLGILLFGRGGKKKARGGESGDEMGDTLGGILPDD